MKIKPFGKYILIEPEEYSSKLLSGDGALRQVGKVISVGDEVVKIKVGDRMIFTDWVEKAKIDEKEYFFGLEDSTFFLGYVEGE